MRNETGFKALIALLVRMIGLLLEKLMSLYYMAGRAGAGGDTYAPVVHA